VPPSIKKCRRRKEEDVGTGVRTKCAGAGEFSCFGLAVLAMAMVCEEKIPVNSRLLWPEGTVIFEVAASEAHMHAQKVLKVQQARVPRGCLLRRVPCNLQVR